MTPQLTEHARRRCQEMGIATKRVKRALRSPDLVYPGPSGYGPNVVVVSDHDPALAIAASPDLRLVFTVLWNGRDSREVAA